MADQNSGGIFDRLSNLVDLLTTLDVRVTNALEGLEEMRSSVTGLDPVREDAEQLVADLRKRLDVWDDRLHRDMDDIKAVLIEKLGDLDLSDLGPRFDRLEEAVFNIERATINMDHSLEGSVEALPDFLSKRVKDQKRKKKAAEETQITEDDLGH